MTISMFTRNKVKDFDVWHKHFWAGIDFVKQNGVIATNVLRDLDDPNLVIVHHQFAEIEAAKAFKAMMHSDLFRKGDPVKKMGVLPETLEMWVAEDA